MERAEDEGRTEVSEVKKERTYEEPEVKKVELKAEEAVLQNCKTSLNHGGNPNNELCFNAAGDPLQTIGS